MTECFTIYADEVENRIDPHFYRPAFIQFYQQLEKTKFEIKTIGGIAEEVTSGATPLSKGDAYTSKYEGIPFIRSGDINEDKQINFDEVLYIKEYTHNKLLKGSKLKKGDVLIAIVGATIGQVSIYDYDKEANINQAIALVRLKQGINPEYVKAFMISKLGQKQLDRIKRPVARANINLDEIRSIKIILPSLAIQNKIIALMENAYKEQENKESKINEFLNSINDYVLDELGIKLPELKDKMVYVVSFDEQKNKRIDAYYYQPKFDEVEKAIKKGKFKIKELKEIVDKLVSGQRPKGGVSQISEGVPTLGGEHVLSDGTIATSDLKYIPKEFHEKQPKSRVQKKDIIIVKDGATTGKIGIVPENYPFEEANINEHVFLLRVKENVNPYYIFSILKSQLGQIQINKEITGGTIMGIIRETTEAIKVPLPPIAIQNKIAEEVKKRMQKAEQLQKEAKEELEKAKKEVKRIILGE
jgi:type I restriction enzyme M protein